MDQCLYDTYHGDPPVLADVASRWPALSYSEQQDYLSNIRLEYQHYNNIIWQMSKPTIDLSGSYEQIDDDMISRAFINGRNRDGCGMVKWAVGKITDAMSSLDTNLSNQKILRDTTLSTSASIEGIAQYLHKMYNAWAANHTGATDLTDFYSQLLMNMPTTPDSSKIVAIRTHLASMISDKESILSRPLELFESLEARAKHMGVPSMPNTPQGTIMPIASGNCSKCDVHQCKGGDDCEVFGDFKKMLKRLAGPKKAAVRKYAICTREYCRKHKLQSAKGLGSKPTNELGEWYKKDQDKRKADREKAKEKSKDDKDKKGDDKKGDDKKSTDKVVAISQGLQRPAVSFEVQDADAFRGWLTRNGCSNLTLMIRSSSGNDADNHALQNEADDEHELDVEELRRQNETLRAANEQLITEAAATRQSTSNAIVPSPGFTPTQNNPALYDTPNPRRSLLSELRSNSSSGKAPAASDPAANASKLPPKEMVAWANGVVTYDKAQRMAKALATRFPISKYVASRLLMLIQLTTSSSMAMTKSIVSNTTFSQKVAILMAAHWLRPLMQPHVSRALQIVAHTLHRMLARTTNAILQRVSAIAHDAVARTIISTAALTSFAANTQLRIADRIQSDQSPSAEQGGLNHERRAANAPLSPIAESPTAAEPEQGGSDDGDDSVRTTDDDSVRTAEQGGSDDDSNAVNKSEHGSSSGVAMVIINSLTMQTEVKTQMGRDGRAPDGPYDNESPTREVALPLEPSHAQLSMNASHPSHNDSACDPGGLTPEAFTAAITTASAFLRNAHIDEPVEVQFIRHFAASQIQSAWRRCAHVNEPVLEPNDLDTAVDRHIAATRIQSAWRQKRSSKAPQREWIPHEIRSALTVSCSPIVPPTVLTVSCSPIVPPQSLTLVIAIDNARIAQRNTAARQLQRAYRNMIEYRQRNRMESIKRANAADIIQRHWYKFLTGSGRQVMVNVYKGVPACDNGNPFIVFSYEERETQSFHYDIATIDDVYDYLVERSGLGNRNDHALIAPSGATLFGLNTLAVSNSAPLRYATAAGGLTCCLVDRSKGASFIWAMRVIQRYARTALRARMHSRSQQVAADAIALQGTTNVNDVIEEMATALAGDHYDWQPRNDLVDDVRSISPLSLTDLIGSDHETDDESDMLIHKHDLITSGGYTPEAAEQAAMLWLAESRGSICTTASAARAASFDAALILAGRKPMCTTPTSEQSTSDAEDALHVRAPPGSALSANSAVPTDQGILNWITGRSLLEWSPTGLTDRALAANVCWAALVIRRRARNAIATRKEVTKLTKIGIRLVHWACNLSKGSDPLPLMLELRSVCTNWLDTVDEDAIVPYFGRLGRWIVSKQAKMRMATQTRVSMPPIIQMPPKPLVSSMQQYAAIIGDTAAFDAVPWLENNVPSMNTALSSAQCVLMVNSPDTEQGVEANFGSPYTESLPGTPIQPIQLNTVLVYAPHVIVLARASNASSEWSISLPGAHNMTVLQKANRSLALIGDTEAEDPMHGEALGMGHNYAVAPVLSCGQALCRRASLYNLDADELRGINLNDFERLREPFSWKRQDWYYALTTDDDGLCEHIHSNNPTLARRGSAGMLGPEAQFDYIMARHLSIADATLNFEQWAHYMAMQLAPGTSVTYTVLTRERMQTRYWDGHRMNSEEYELWRARRVAILRKYPAQGSAVRLNANSINLTPIHSLNAQPHHAAHTVLRSELRMSNGMDVDLPDTSAGSTHSRSQRQGWPQSSDYALVTLAAPTHRAPRSMAATAVLDARERFVQRVVLPCCDHGEICHGSVLIASPEQVTNQGGTIPLLCDDGASIYCMRDIVGLIDGSLIAGNHNLEVGDDSASLSTTGTGMHAMTWMDENNTEFDNIRRWHHTPNCVCAGIISEPQEVYRHGASFMWSAESGRVMVTANSDVNLMLAMGENGLGWLRGKPLTCPVRIRSLLAHGQLEVITNPSTNLMMLVAPVQQKLEQKPERSMGRLVHYSAVQLLRRAHIVLGHASVKRVLDTLEIVAPHIRRRITATVVAAFLKEGCGGCDSTHFDRPPFKSIKDGTRPEPGKVWTFDTLALKRPSFFHGIAFVTVYIDRGSGPNGFAMLFGHKRQNEESIEACTQKLRIAVRPVHGEIAVLRHDGHPAMRSHKWEDFVTDSTIEDQRSAPYCHEGATDAEIYFQHQVPAANALERGAGEDECMHSFAALRLRTAVRNITVDRDDGSSPSSRYGDPNPIDFGSIFAFGASVKFLTHPEVRDSKFDDHAEAGQYRGPSAESPSNKLCWVSTHSRYVTVDIGCTRFDERAVLQRTQRDHSYHQPHMSGEYDDDLRDFTAWDLPGDDKPAPTQWMDTAAWTQSNDTDAPGGSQTSTPPHVESRDLSHMFIEGTIPDVPFTLLVFGGKVRDGSIAAYCEQQATDSTSIYAVVVDTCIGGHAMDVMAPSVTSRLCDFIAAPNCIVVGLSMQCNSFTAAKLNDNGGPPPDRNREFPLGIEVNGAISPAARTGNIQLKLCIELMRIAQDNGTAIWFEHPVARHDRNGNPWHIVGREEHISVWDHPYLVSFLTENVHSYHLVTIDQCAVEHIGIAASTRKTTHFLVSASMRSWANEHLAVCMCNHAGAHSNAPENASANVVQSGSECFPPGLCALLAAFTYAAARLKLNQPASAASYPSSAGWPEPSDPFPENSYVDVFWSKPAATRGWYRAQVTRSDYQIYKTVKPQRFIEVIYDHDGAEYSHYLRNSVIRKSELSVPYLATEASEPDAKSTTTLAGAAMIADCDDATINHEHAGIIAAISAQGKLPRAAEVASITSPPADAFINHDAAFYIDVAELTRVHPRGIVLSVGNESYTLNVDQVRSWSAPKNEREYRRCPQRAMWRTSQELKMEDYFADNKLKLVSAREAKDGIILRTIWARTIKEHGDRAKLAPRLCADSSRVSKSKTIWDTYSDVMRSSSMKIIFFIGTLRYTYRAQIDESDAFQTTFVDGSDPKVKQLPPLYLEQAPGHEIPNENGEIKGPDRLVYLSNVAWQGRPDACKIFGSRLARIFTEDCQFVPSVWDPKVFILHNGPLAGQNAHLTDILEACAKQPATVEEPLGWMIIGVHVDDGIAVASNEAMVKWCVTRISIVYACKYSPWQKVLGFDIDARPLENGTTRIRVSAEGTLENVDAEFLSTTVRLRPKHVMTAAIDSLGPGARPPEDDPDRPAFDAMQSETRSMLGIGMWLRNVYCQLSYPTHRGTEFMHNPSWECNKSIRLALMHIVAYPIAPTFCYDGSALEVAPAECIKPYANGCERAPGAWLHCFVDASLRDKAVTSIVTMLGKVVIDEVVQRQLLKVTGSHVAEVTAASSAVNRIIPIRGLLQECGIVQEHATPLYIDSTTTIFVAKDLSGVKRSIWILRRTGVLHEAVQMEEIDPQYLNTHDNVANVNTKYTTYKPWLRHMYYMLNVPIDDDTGD